MKKFYNYIIYLGVDSLNKDKDTNKKIKLLNIYVFIWLHLTAVFQISELLTGQIFDRTIMQHIITVIILLLNCTILISNKYRCTKQAKTLFIFNAFLAFNLSAFYVNPGTYTEYYFILIPGFALSLFDNKWIASVLTFLGFISLSLPYMLGVYPEDYKLRFNFVSLGALFLAVYCLINYFKKMNKQNELLLELEKDKVLSDKMMLEKQEKELRELNEFKSHFFVNLSHEIRTPLTLIQGYTSQLSTAELEQENVEKLNVVKQEVSNMQSIVNDIMDLSKMDTHEFDLKKEFTDVHELLSKIFTTFKPLFDEKGVLFQLNSIPQNRALNIDVSLFDKAITNLLSNALKFTTQGERVVLSAKLLETGMIIEVTDTGIGIPKEALPKLFDRFYQVKNHITQSVGSGIGLAFVKSIINHHGFSIRVNSTLGKETCFSIDVPKNSIKVLPLSEKSSPVDVAVNLDFKQKNKSDNKRTLGAKNILVVDDYPQMRTYIKSILTSYHITEATDGKHALEIMSKNTFDLIVTDFMMPVMDGKDLVKEIKKKGISTPIIVVTARTDSQGKLDMLRLGIDGYLFKPFLEEELKIQVANGIKLYYAMKNFQKELPKKEITLLDRQAVKFNETLTKYINKEIASKSLNVEEIATNMNISRSTLNRKARLLLGQSVKDLILESRLQKVKNLIETDPDMTKTQLVQAVGMSNTTHLFEKFNERFGVSV